MAVEVIAEDDVVHVLRGAQEQGVLLHHFVGELGKGPLVLVDSANFVVQVLHPVCGEEFPAEFCHEVLKGEHVVDVAVLEVPALHQRVE